MQGSHTHIPETNHVPRRYVVAAILFLLFMVPLCLIPALILLFFYVSTSRSMCAVPNMAVFCSSLTSWFPGMSLTYFLNDLEMVPVAQIVTGITLVFTLYYYYYYYYYYFERLKTRGRFGYTDFHIQEHTAVQGHCFIWQLSSLFDSDSFARLQAAQRMPLFQFSLRRYPRLSVPSIAVNIRFVLITLDEGASGISLRLADKRHINRTRCSSHVKVLQVKYRSADSSLARPGRKQATATEDFEFVYPICNHNWRNIGTIYISTICITRLASNEIFSPSNKIHREVGRAKDLAPR